MNKQGLALACSLLESGCSIGVLLLANNLSQGDRGSHHILRKEGVAEKINLQRAGNKAKPYQVKQVRNVIVKYKLGGDIDV